MVFSNDQRRKTQDSALGSDICTCTGNSGGSGNSEGNGCPEERCKGRHSGTEGSEHQTSIDRTGNAHGEYSRVDGGGYDRRAESETWREHDLSVPRASADAGCTRQKTHAINVKKSFKRAKKLKILSINARSLRSADQRNEFELYLTDNDFDIIMVQETRWDSTMTENILNIPNFSIASRSDRVPDNKGGGCAILTKDDVMYNNAFKKSINMHTQIAGIKVKDLYIVCIYRRPHLDKNIDKLTVGFLKNKLSNKKVFIAGDLNLRNFDWKCDVVSGNTEDETLSKINTRDAIWKDFMIEMDLEQLIDDPTHDLDGQLDVVIKNMDYDIITTQPEVKPELFGAFTDHYAIVAEVNIVIEQRSKIRTIFDEKRMPWDEVRMAIEERKMSEKLNPNIHADKVWTLIRDTVFEVRGKLCPTKKVGFSRQSPWINNYLRCLLRKERKK